MPDMGDFLKAVKIAAMDANDSTKPMQVLFGTVTKDDPLEITVSQKMILEEDDLILCRNVTDYEVDIQVSHWTEYEKEHQHTVNKGGIALPTMHRHEYKGRKKIKIYNALKKDDVVVLLREQGGQRFIVVDRIKPIPDAELKGEWNG